MSTICNSTLLVDGSAAFDEILRCIDAAEKSIMINMFIWRDDTIGNRLGRAILHAADRGVRITISVDRVGMVLELCEESERSFFHQNPVNIKWHRDSCRRFTSACTRQKYMPSVDNEKLTINQCSMTFSDYVSDQCQEIFICIIFGNLSLRIIIGW